jgi:hypothetical protein
MAQPTLFINSFAKGSAENSNLGIGTMLGVENYSNKGVAQLTKDTTAGIQSGFTWSSLPKYIVADNLGNYYAIALSGTTCEIYYSTDGGVTWFDSGKGISNARPTGMIFYNNGNLGLGYVFIFVDTAVWYFPVTNPVVIPSPTSFKTGLNNIEHPSFLSPFDNFIYFGNGNLVGRIGIVLGNTFNPGGSLGTGYQYSASQLSLPSIYVVSCLSFLPVNYMALGTTSPTNSQVADIILWNPTNSTYETPLRLYSKASFLSIQQLGPNDGEVYSGITQLINRDNLLYAVTGGDYSVYETNGSTFSLVESIGLRSNIRTTGGTQSNLPVFFGGYAAAIGIIGNKILTGISTPANPGYPSTYGLFPCGVWTLAFSDGGGIGAVSYGINGNSVQCEFTISTNTTVANGAGGAIFQIGCILPTTSNSALISWADNSSGSPVYGIDYIETNNFQSNSSTVLIESEMMEVGSPLSPVTIGNLQVNLVRKLMTGQTISVLYRTGFDQDFTSITSYGFNGTFTGDGTTNAYPITNHQIGPTQYVQFQIRMATVTPGTSATIATYTPQLRNFIVGNTNTN